MNGRDDRSLTCAQAGPMMAAMLLGELDARDQRVVKAHLFDCAACRRELREIEETLCFLEENNPLTEAPVEQLSGGRLDELMEVAAYSEVECNVEAMAAARVPSDAEERASRGMGTGDALTLRAALARWGLPRAAQRPLGPAFAGFAATVLAALALAVSLWLPGGEAVARNATTAARHNAAKPIRLVEVTTSAPLAERISEIVSTPTTESAPQSVADATRPERPATAGAKEVRASGEPTAKPADRPNG